MEVQRTQYNALFSIERIYTNCRCLRVCQRLLERRHCCEFTIQTGSRNITVATEHWICTQRNITPPLLATGMIEMKLSKRK